MAESVLYISASILGLQVIYLTTLVYAFRRRPEEVPSGVMPPVSILVSAHDEETNLRELIPLLLDQEYAEFEVIVVEDRCNDGTFDYLLEETRKQARLKMVRVQQVPDHVNGKKFALTLGIKAAAHEWILFTDADCRPSSRNWIQSMAAHCAEDKQIVLGYSPYFRNHGHLNSMIRFEALLTAIQYMGFARLGSPYMGVGRNLAYRKSLFLGNKGFNKYLGVTGGDDDLFVNQHATKQNTAICIDPQGITRSFPKQSWGSFLQQKLRHLAAGKRYKFNDKFKLSVFSVTWILTWLMVLPIAIQPSTWSYYLLAGLVVREGLLVFLVHRASRMLGESFEAWKTPLLDLNYAVYYLGTGLVALIAKRVRWMI